MESTSISLGRSFPGVVELPPVCREEKDELIRTAMDGAAEKKRDPNTI